MIVGCHCSRVRSQAGRKQFTLPCRVGEISLRISFNNVCRGCHIWLVWVTPKQARSYIYQRGTYRECLLALFAGRGWRVCWPLPLLWLSCLQISHILQQSNASSFFPVVALSDLMRKQVGAHGDCPIFFSLSD
ncbi:hypothetical protein Ancab_032151 [Ancistrocladus abbreviatus]